jgi:hypothetical protein
MIESSRAIPKDLDGGARHLRPDSIARQHRYRLPQFGHRKLLNFLV